MDTFTDFKSAIEILKKELDVDITELSNMLGINNKVIQEWECLPIFNNIPKSKRLSKLYDIVKMIKDDKTYNNVNIKETLYSCKIVYNKDDLQNGTICLIHFLNSQGDEKLTKMMLEQSLRERGSNGHQD